jgi:hypothetical protein
VEADMHRALLMTSVLLTGCICCDSTTPYLDVPRGGELQIEAEDLEIPTCFDSCIVKLDVANSHRHVVRVLWEGNPDVVPPPTHPIIWDTRDDDGQTVPEDMYVVRAWRDNERMDAVVVFVFE